MKIKAVDFICYVLMILFCTTRFWKINIPWYVNVLVRLFGICFLIISNNLKISFDKKVGKAIRYTAFPIILILLYSCFLWLFSDDKIEVDIVRNLFSSSTYLIIDLIFAALIYQRYRKKSIDIFVSCAFLTYMIGSVIPMLLKFNFEGLLFLLTTQSKNYQLLYYVEINDLTFAVGFCLLYYLFFSNNEVLSNKKNIIKCILLTLWGFKRIEIAALLLCFLFYKFILSKINIKKSSFIACIIIIIISYLYIMIIHNNNILSLASKYHIDFMGRLTTYTYVTTNYSSFSLLFPGIGFGYIDEILEQLEAINFKLNYVPIISLHSDLLRMYIGIGFIAFGIWIVYQSYIKTKLIYKHIDLNCAKAYLLFTIYLFILYLTDNTYSYPICFTLYFLCTLCSISESKKNSI